ncbi:MAG TPA: TaqI-like C-terminal specificity domain-containing protein [Candidatus Deferrimicrobium sp.]|nr:TaqI-like C-terminal specificity domain-containing protein [Candidatus Deferrimicrobium sp.]
MKLQTILEDKRKLIKLLKLRQAQEPEYPHHSVDEPLKKKKGIYYTPPEITTYLVFQTISYFISETLDKEQLELFNYLQQNSPKALQTVLQHLETVKILDPACGAGIFLIKSAEILFQLQKYILTQLNLPFKPNTLKRAILLNNIYGVDLFEDAIQNTQTRLLHWLKTDVESIATEESIINLEGNIRLANSLIGWLSEDLGIIECENIYKGTLKTELNSLLNELSPDQTKFIQNIINLLDSTQLDNILQAFFSLKNLQNDELSLFALELQSIIQHLHKLIYQIVNPLFISTLLTEDSSKKAKEDLLCELIAHKVFHWNVDFGEIMRNGGFNIIVGNPPYVFIRGKNFSNFEQLVYKKNYLGNYKSLAKGKARQSSKFNSFSLFLVRGIHLLKKKGHLGFIIPNTTLRTTTNDFIRQFILDNTFIQEMVDLKGDIFKRVTASTILLFLQKIHPLPNSPTLINLNVKDLLDYQYSSHFINQNRFYNNPVLAFNIHLDSECETIFELMRKDTFDLGKITNEIIEGIVCRKSDQLFSDDSTHPLSKKLLRGKDIGRYQINWKPNQYILYATDTKITEKKLHRPRPQWIYEAPEKLITQRIGGGIYPIQVAYDASQYYTFASINNIILKNPPIYKENEYLYKYIIGLLNSKLINAYYLLNFSNQSSLTVNISKTYLESLPIKKAALTYQKIISNIVDYLLFLNQFQKNQLQIINYFDLSLLDTLIFELYFQDHLKTNLFGIIAEYLIDLPLNNSSETIYSVILEIYRKMHETPQINRTIDKIRLNPIIHKIENVFQKRLSLITEKSPN